MKALDILVEYGSMLVDPSTTFGSVRERIAFLRTMLADGSGGAVFCRMLPTGQAHRDAARVDPRAVAGLAGCAVRWDP